VTADPCDLVQLDAAWQSVSPAQQKRTDSVERERIGVYEAQRRTRAA